jgi:hypothetical protein
MATYTRRQLQSLAAAAAARYGIDPRIFAAQINQESGWNPKAGSSAGAEGIAQFMPGTASSMGVNPWDPVSALNGAARYDANELKAFHGNYREALAAYNAGAGNADKWNDPSFANGQTYNYVRNILAAAGHGAGATVPAPVGPQGSVSPPNATGASVNAGGSMSRRQLANLIFGGANRVDFNSGQINVPNLMVLAQARQQLAQSQPSTASRTKAAALVGGGGKMVPNPTGSSIPFIGDTAGVNPGLLAHVSAAAKAAGATQIRVTSGFRSPEHNAAVGGVSDSNHTTGHALDGEAYIPGRGWLPLGQVLLPVAGKFGLRSGDVPGFFNGNPDPVHVDDGWNVTH